jgi:hypothetical protein
MNTLFVFVEVTDFYFSLSRFAKSEMKDRAYGELCHFLIELSIIFAIALKHINLYNRNVTLSNG